MAAISLVVVKQMIRAITAPLEIDGASVEVSSVESEEITLTYRKGTCEDCVMHPDDLAAIVLETLRPQLPQVRRIDVIEVAS